VEAVSGTIEAFLLCPRLLVEQPTR
jgi:hypothetical protein